MILARRISKRIAKLEDQFGTAQGETPHLLVFTAVASELVLDEDRCIEILRECGHLPTGPGFGIVNLWEIPDGLNAQELEKYLRTNGAQVCGFGRGQEESAPSGASRASDSSWSSHAQMSAGVLR